MLNIRGPFLVKIGIFLAFPHLANRKLVSERLNSEQLLSCEINYIPHFQGLNREKGWGPFFRTPKIPLKGWGGKCVRPQRNEFNRSDRKFKFGAFAFLSDLGLPGIVFWPKTRYVCVIPTVLRTFFLRPTVLGYEGHLCSTYKEVPLPIKLFTCHVLIPESEIEAKTFNEANFRAKKASTFLFTFVIKSEVLFFAFVRSRKKTCWLRRHARSITYEAPGLQKVIR